MITEREKCPKFLNICRKGVWTGTEEAGSGCT